MISSEQEVLSNQLSTLTGILIHVVCGRDQAHVRILTLVYIQNQMVGPSLVL